ncbi:hypothetical protein Ancab_035014 [Ancistrocladus abbreviatus]
MAATNDPTTGKVVAAPDGAGAGAVAALGASAASTAPIEAATITTVMAIFFISIGWAEHLLVVVERLPEKGLVGQAENEGKR